MTTTTAGITATGTILDKIVARKIEEVAALDASNLAAESNRTPLDFIAALRRRPSVGLISEIKHA